MAKVWPNAAEEMAWENRKTLIYHFFAYKYFSLKEPNSSISSYADKQPKNSTARGFKSIDLINLDDADIQCYNHECNKVRIMKDACTISHFLYTFRPFHEDPAKSIAGFRPYPDKDASYRKDLITHVVYYNRRVHASRRFQMIHLTSDETTFMRQIKTENNNRKVDTKERYTLKNAGFYGMNMVVKIWGTMPRSKQKKKLASQNDKHVTTLVQAHIIECQENPFFVKQKLLRARKVHPDMSEFFDDITEKTDRLGFTEGYRGVGYSLGKIRDPRCCEESMECGKGCDNISHCIKEAGD